MTKKDLTAGIPEAEVKAGVCKELQRVGAVYRHFIVSNQEGTPDTAVWFKRRMTLTFLNRDMFLIEFKKDDGVIAPAQEEAVVEFAVVGVKVYYVRPKDCSPIFAALRQLSDKNIRDWARSPECMQRGIPYSEFKRIMQSCPLVK